MPGLVAALFGSLASFFAAWVTKKAALGAAAVTTFIGLTVLLWTSVQALLSGVGYMTLNSSVGLGMAMMVPDNAAPIFAAYVSARMARWAYDNAIENIRILSYVT